VPIGANDDAAIANLWVGAAKSAFGAAAHAVMPLRIPVPALGGDACEAAEQALAVAAQRERQSLILNLGGGVLVNVAGGVYLGVATDDWGTAGLSVALGVAVASVAVWTQPRAAWRRPIESLTPIVVPGEQPLVGVTGRF